MFKLLKLALSEGSDTSSLRLFIFISLMFFVPALMFGYIWNVVTDNPYQWSYVLLMCGLMTGIYIIKTFQYSREKKPVINRMDSKGIQC